MYLRSSRCSVLRAASFLVGGLTITIGFVLFTGIQAQAASEEGSSGSVELGLLELSPKGEAGGYAMPASGCSTIHRRCTAGNWVNNKEGGTYNCTSYQDYQHSCSLSATLEARRYNGSWTGYTGNNINIANGNRIQVRWRSDTSDGKDENKIRCTATNFSRAGGTDRSIGSAPGRTNIEVTEPAAQKATTYRINCSFNGLTASDSLKVTNISPLPVNGSCGTANGRTYRYNDRNYGSYSACSRGSASGFAFPPAGGSDSWSCSGAHGGSPASCTAYRAASPSPVTGLTYSCNSAGTQVTLSWNAAPGATGYYIRRYIDPATWGNPSCTGTNSASNPGYCHNDYKSTSVTLNVPPEQSFDFWMHARDAVGSWGPTARLDNIVCAPPDDDLDPDDPTINGFNPSGRTYYVGDSLSLATTQRNTGSVASAGYRLRFRIERNGAWNASVLNTDFAGLAANATRPHSSTWSPTLAGSYSIQVLTEDAGQNNFNFTSDTDSPTGNDVTAMIPFTVLETPDCRDGIDNDGDGRVDGADAGCPGGGGPGDNDDSETDPAPTVSLTATPSSVVSGGSSDLVWTVTNANSCTASGDWSGSKSASGGLEELTGLTSDGTYNLSCTGQGGTRSDDASITITTPGGGSACPSPRIEADNTIVQKGDDVEITWQNSDDAAACVVTGPGVSEAGTVGCADQSFTVNDISNTADYTLTCNGIEIDAVKVNVLPAIQET